MISHYYRELDPVEQEAAVERRSQEIRERCVATGCTDDAMVGAVLCGEHFAETSRWVRAGMKGLRTVPVFVSPLAATSAPSMISSSLSRPLNTCTWVSLFRPVVIFFSTRLSPAFTQIKAGVPVLGAESIWREDESCR